MSLGVGWQRHASHARCRVRSRPCLSARPLSTAHAECERFELDWPERLNLGRTRSRKRSRKPSLAPAPMGERSRSRSPIGASRRRSSGEPVNHRTRRRAGFLHDGHRDSADVSRRDSTAWPSARSFSVTCRHQTVTNTADDRLDAEALDRRRARADVLDTSAVLTTRASTRILIAHTRSSSRTRGRHRALAVFIERTRRPFLRYSRPELRSSI